VRVLAGHGRRERQSPPERRAPGSVSLYDSTPCWRSLAAWPRRGRVPTIPPAAVAPPRVGNTVGRRRRLPGSVDETTRGPTSPVAMTAKRLAQLDGRLSMSLVGRPGSATTGTLSVAVLVAAYVLIGLAVLHRRTIAVGGWPPGSLPSRSPIWVIAPELSARCTPVRRTDPNTGAESSW